MFRVRFFMEINFPNVSAQFEYCIYIFDFFTVNFVNILIRIVTFFIVIYSQMLNLTHSSLKIEEVMVS